MRKTKLRSSIDATFWNGLSDMVVKGLTTGSLLTAYAFSFGMSSVVLGFLQSVVSFSNLIHLPVSLLLERGISPKKIACFSSVLSRPFLLLVALSFLLKESAFGMVLFIVSYVLFYLGVGITGGAFWPWCKQLVPTRVTTSFFAHRTRYILLVKMITMGIVTFLLSVVSKAYSDRIGLMYTAFLFIAFIMGLFYTYTLFRMSDVKLHCRPNISFGHKLIFVCRNKSFLSFFLNIGFCNFSLSFLTPFFTLFLLKKIGMSVSCSLLFSVGSMCVDMLFIDVWKRYAKQKGLARMISYATIFFVIATCYLIYISCFPEFHKWLLLIVASLFMGIGSAGLNLGITDASISYVPKKMSSVYISLMNVGRFGFSGLGAFMAGICLDIFEKNTSHAWAFFFLLAGTLFALSGLMIRRVTYVKDTVK